MMQKTNLAKRIKHRLAAGEPSRRVFVFNQDYDDKNRYTLQHTGQVMNRATAKLWASRRTPRDIVLFVNYDETA